jgi:hypothetical protein
MANFRETRVASTGRFKTDIDTPVSVSADSQEKRRGVRLNSRVPVAVEWEIAGQMERGQAQTRIVGPYGCLVVLPQHLELGQKVQLTNLVTKQSGPAVIVWRGHQRSEGWELGIELIDPNLNFWGLDL